MSVLKNLICIACQNDFRVTYMERILEGFPRQSLKYKYQNMFYKLMSTYLPSEVRGNQRKFSAECD